MYTRDVVFENKYTVPEITTSGKQQYMTQVEMFKIKQKMWYFNSRVELLKATVSESDGSVYVRWRICGIKRFKTLFVRYRIRSGAYKYMMRINET
jgi:hypothetical protein